MYMYSYDKKEVNEATCLVKHCIYLYLQTASVTMYFVYVTILSSSLCLKINKALERDL